jgi:hypothetical protein
MKTITELNTKFKDLTIAKVKLDRFFTKFLDKFDKQMDSCNTNTPIWKLYNTKCKEYEEITYQIRSTEYYMNKVNDV